MIPHPSFQTELEADPNAGLVKKRGAPWEKNFTFFRSAIQVFRRSTGRSSRRSSPPNLPHVLDRTFHRQTVFGVAFPLVYAEHGPSPPSRSTRPQSFSATISALSQSWTRPSVPNPNALLDMFEPLKANHLGFAGFCIFGPRTSFSFDFGTLPSRWMASRVGGRLGHFRRRTVQLWWTQEGRAQVRDHDYEYLVGRRYYRWRQDGRGRCFYYQ